MSPAAERVELAEWQQRELVGVHLSVADRELSEQLRGGSDAQLVVDDLHWGVRITARSWVGVVRFDAFEVSIVPKLAGHTPGLVSLLEFAADLDALKRNASRRTLPTADLGLFDLLALLLAEACEGILRGGILTDYVEREEELPVVRGRLLGDRQVLQRFGRLDRLICRFDEHEQDVPENQLLALALKVSAARIRDAGLRRRVYMLRDLFHEVCSPEALDLPATRSSLTYQRLNEHYRDAHALAWLILDGLRINDVLAVGSTGSFAFLIDMNVLFERFVHRLVGGILRPMPMRLHYQRRDASIIMNVSTNRSYSRVIPDLLIETTSSPITRLTLDAKYKLYDEHKLDPSDVYQSFLYAHAYGSGRGSTPPAAVLIYPSSRSTIRTTHLRVKNFRGVPAAELFVVGISIPEALDEVRRKVPGPATRTLLETITRAIDESGEILHGATQAI
jgi:5-methylcytosine-specific restriction enzyme subunit McrC